MLMPVGALMLFGGETLQDFAFALLVGVASGAYSSIFIATPVLMEWKEREPVYMRRRRLVMQDHGGLVPAFATGALTDGAAGGGLTKAPAPTRADAVSPAAPAPPTGPRRPGSRPPLPANPPATRPAARRRQRRSRAGEEPCHEHGAAHRAPKPKRSNRPKKKHGRR